MFEVSSSGEAKVLALRSNKKFGFDTFFKRIPISAEDLEKN